MPSNSKTSRLRDEIDANLRRAFDDVVNDDIPDPFTDLLSQLRQKEAKLRETGDHNDT